MTKLNRSTQTTRTERPQRVPVSGHRNVLTVKGLDENYVYRWVNDENGKIDAFELGGYEPVTDDVEVGQRKLASSDKVGSVVTKAVGNGVTAVLMRIKREWYEEDQAAKEREIDKTEEAMKQEVTNSGYKNAKFEIS